MTSDQSGGFNPSANYPLPAVAALSASIQDQERLWQQAAASIAEAQEAKFQRQAERDARQADLVELQRKADEREAQRDVERVERSKAETKRRHWEIGRWVFTTSVAVAGLTVAIIAIIALITR